jgi:hypothetical protein
MVAAGAIQANGSLRSAGTAMLTATRIRLAPAAELRSDGRLTLTANAGATALNLANGDDSLFLQADMARVFAPSLQLAAGSRTVAIGASTLFPNVNAVGVATTGDIDVLGTLNFASSAGAPRTLTLGGEAAADTAGTGAGLASQARSINIRVTSAGPGSPVAGGQIAAAGSVVRLNGQFVAAGLPGQFLETLLAATPPDTATVRRLFTEQPTSRFYVAAPPYLPPRYNTVLADRLVLRVQQWGLIQNSDTAAQPGGGIDLQAVQLLGAAGGPADGPVIGFFGALGGQDGIAAALRINREQLGGISPNNVRINGCVALSTAGCIVTGLPLPIVQLNDPGRALLVNNTPELILPVELISGTTNEALWRDDDDLAPAVPEPVPATPVSGAQP